MSVAEVSDSTSLSFKNNVSAYKLLVVRDGELCYGSERDLYIIPVCNVLIINQYSFCGFIVLSLDIIYNNTLQSIAKWWV